MSNVNSEIEQQNNQSQESINTFDVNRAMLRDKDIFASFHVKTTYPLQEALDRGEVRGKRPILVMNHKAGTLSFLTHQINPHHLAYGEMAGKPWMVIF